ncbi:hypothetical protein LCGC14_1306200 [marine sediment metagenome]|uniref:Uncharacterized protein n=1 Tax=marine sediment metagenome TaxID=412755 RepID=A0A0F9NR48_9ZZZZ
MIRARACLKCKEYVIIHPNNPVNQVELKNFDKKHLGHTLIIVGFGEIKGIYTSFKSNGGGKPPEDRNLISFEKKEHKIKKS